MSSSLFASSSFSLFYLFKIFLVTGAAFADGVAGADGTAAALASCSRVDDGLPDVAVFALPPNLSPAAGEHLVGCEGAVFGWVPFGCDLWIFCGEIVEAWQHLNVAAIWAAAVALGAAGDDGLIFVAFVADPPDFFVAERGDLIGPQAAVFCRMPLSGDLRILAGEIIFSGNDLFAGADWTAAAVGAAGNAGLIFVAFVADPPNLAARAGRHLVGCEVAVFCRMPLAGELWILAGEIVHAADHDAIGADWTAGTVDAGFHLRLPFVAFVAHPPDDAVGADGHILRPQVAIFCRMPLGHEVWIKIGDGVFERSGIMALMMIAATVRA